MFLKNNLKKFGLTINLKNMDIEKMSLEKITKHEIESIKYGDFKKLSEKLGVEMEKTFGVKKNVLAKDLWRAVCAKREQLEAGMTEEEITKDNLARKQKRAKAILDAKAQEELEKERAKSMAQNMNLGIAEALVKQFGHGARNSSGN